MLESLKFKYEQTTKPKNPWMKLQKLTTISKTGVRPGSTRSHSGSYSMDLYVMVPV